MDLLEMKRSLPALYIVASVTLAFMNCVVAKPTINFDLGQKLHELPLFSTLTQQILEKRSAQQTKTYSGLRVRNDSSIMVYFYDSTIAITELGPARLLLSCELLEIYDEKTNPLQNLNRTLKVSFKDMFKLMEQCELVDRSITNGSKWAAAQASVGQDADTDATPNDAPPFVYPSNPLSLLSGIIPGTKWCGLGDIATTYHDLGTDEMADRCCRSHDLCPVKIRPMQSKYALDNNAIYTKSHCACDKKLRSCLEAANTHIAQLLSNVYFKIVRAPCLDGDGENGTYTFGSIIRGF